MVFYWSIKPSSLLENYYQEGTISNVAGYKDKALDNMRR